MPIGTIRWGAASSGRHYENELLLGYAPFAPVDDRPPRAGSEWVQAPSGVEDAWITGRDYELSCEVRFIPDDPAGSTTVPGTVRSPVAGPNSWMQFLDYARDKNTFRLCPYSSLPDFFIDGVYLVEPTSGFGSNNDLLQRTLPLKLRNPSVPWTQALIRGVALEYAPGQPSTGTGLDAVDSRAGAASYTAKSGVLVQVSSNVLRERHYPPPSTTPTLLLERASTNLCFWSQDFTQAAWNPTGVLVSSGVDDPMGGTNAQTLTSSSASGGYVSMLGLAPGASYMVGSVYVRNRSWMAAQVQLYSTGAGAVLAYASFDLVNGALTTGTPGLRYSIEQCGTFPGRQPWYRIAVGCSSAATADVRMLVIVCSSSGAQGWVPASTSRAIDVFGAQLETGTPYRTSYIPTTGAASAVRGVDSFYFPLPAGFQKPQASWLYVKFIERGAGAVNLTGVNTPRLLGIESTAAGSPSLEILGTGRVYSVVLTSSSGGVVSTNCSTGPSFGDTVELLALVSSSGQVKIQQALNGGPSSSAAGGALGFLPAAWDGAELWLNSPGQPGSAGYAAWTEFLCVKMGPGNAVSTIAAARSA